MPVTKDDVLAALGKVAAPDGAPLPQAGVLSDIVASDGKVFFSITVDAGVVQAWEGVRKRAEDAVKAINGHADGEELQLGFDRVVKGKIERRTTRLP